MPNFFNLIDEPWIPIIGCEPVSLKQLFCSSGADHAELGGNPIQKIAITRLLLAIAQSAYTPQDEASCHSFGPGGLATRCLTYLEKWYEAFWLYGEKPFLQMPTIKRAKPQQPSALLPGAPAGNTSLIFQTQNEKMLSEADNALLIVTLMGFGLGDKKTDNTLSLTRGYEKKTIGRPGTCVGYRGYLHSFVLGSTVLETVWLNLLTYDQLNNQKSWSKGLGTAPWERMPDGEDCPTAKEMKESYLGRLVPLSRFCLLSEDGLHYSEGISFSSHKEGGVDPSVAVDRNKKEWKAEWVDPEKRPWRMIPAFLSYLGKTKTNSYDCIFIQVGLERAKDLPSFGIWSGGLRVSSNNGQFVSGRDDFVESKILLSADNIGNSDWFSNIEKETQFLNDLSDNLKSSVSGYFKQLKMDGSNHAGIAANQFWQLCERHSQELFQAEAPKNLRKHFAKIAIKIYDQLCPKETARQITSWANNRSKLNIARIL